MKNIFEVFAVFVVCFLEIQAQPEDFRISAVQENQVWIEGGLLDGLEEGMRGEVFYEITIAGQAKHIVPAKVELYKVEDRQSIGTLKEQTGNVNFGYRVSIVPRPPGDMLTLFQTRATEAFAGGDFNLAKQFYQRILQALPEDPFATHKIKECDVELEKLAAVRREIRNIPYYKQAIKASMESKDEESIELVRTYADKILAVAPDDPEALRYKDWAISRPQKEALVKAEPEERAAAKPEEDTAQKKEAAAIPEKAKVVEKTVIERPPLLEDMVLIAESEVVIGSEPDETQFANETPRQKVHVAAFYVDKYEVTNEDYKRFCAATGRSYPGYFVDGNYPEGTARRPVVMVSWIDADAYARWAGKRLLSEREWEAAAAGTSARTWPWGDTWDSGLANTREAGAAETADVGSHPGDTSAFGMCDMAGNVSEWTEDWYQPYPGNTRKEKEYGEQFKVLRGGSFQVSREFARCQFRARLPDGFRSMDLGFRCAISAADGR
jgi:formylglycine-generating enzyme required for sulfatase activity